MRFQRILAMVFVALLILSGPSIAFGSSRDVDGTETRNNFEDEQILFAGGNGTESDPYEISNVTQLQNMNENLSAHYELVNDIDASETKNWNNGSGFIPIGRYFTGSLDGQGYNIIDLYIYRPNSYYVGLFESIWENGSIINIGLVNVNVNGGTSVGGLAGQNFRGKIANSYITGNVSGKKEIGGLVGFNSKGMINNSYTNGYVIGDEYVGILVGNNEGSINNSYAKGYVEGERILGGLVGFNTDKISNSYYNIDEVIINGKHRVTWGGLFNYQYQDWISSNKTLRIEDYSDTLIPNNNYYEITEVQGIKDLLGFADEGEYRFCLSKDLDFSEEPGLYIPYLNADLKGNGQKIKNLHLNWSAGCRRGMIGYLGEEGSLEDISLINYKVIGFYDIGGFIGYNNGRITDSYIDGEISGVGNVGELVGKNKGLVENTYATGKVKVIENNLLASPPLGGLVGNNKGLIKNSNATVNVTGYGKLGGLVGDNSGTVANSSATGDVSGSWNSIGGLVGNNGGTIENSYAKGNASGDKYVSGLVGINYGSLSKIKNSYATGKVDGTEYIGGITGYNDGTISNSFWDVNTTGQSSSAGGTGKTTAEMKDIDTFTNESTTGLQQAWDFVGNPNDDMKNDDIWDIDESGQINDGYPYFKGSTGANTAPTVPTAPYPADGATDVNISPTLSVSVSDPDGDTMNVTFYHASNDSVIDSNSGVTNGTTSVTWSGLSYNTTYEWYAVANDSQAESQSSTWSFTTRVEDNQAPTADAGDDRTVDEDTPVTFDASGSTDNVGITDYTWTIEGNEYSGMEVQHTFNDPENYTVTLNVSDAAGKYDTDTVNITVEDVTAPIADAGADQTVGMGEEFTLNGSSSSDNVGIVNYTWTIVGSEYTGIEVTHSLSEVGAYEITLNVTDAAGNYDTDTVTITVEDQTPPTAVVEGDKTTVTIGETISFDGSSSSDNFNVTSYSWDFGDGNTDTGETATHSYSSAGNYTVILTVTDAAGNSDTDTINITVEEEAQDTEPPVADAGADKTVNVGENFTLDASASSDNMELENYTWTIKGEEYQGEQLTYNFSSKGNYTVTLTVEDGAGNTDTDTVNITVEKQQDTDGGDETGGEGGTEPGEEGSGWMMYLIPIILIIVVIAGVLYWKSRGTETSEEETGDEPWKDDWENEEEETTESETEDTEEDLDEGSEDDEIDLDLEENSEEEE